MQRKPSRTRERSTLWSGRIHRGRIQQKEDSRFHSLSTSILNQSFYSFSPFFSHAPTASRHSRQSVQSFSHSHKTTLEKSFARFRQKGKGATETGSRRDLDSTQASQGARIKNTDCIRRTKKIDGEQHKNSIPPFPQLNPTSVCMRSTRSTVRHQNSVLAEE